MTRLFFITAVLLLALAGPARGLQIVEEFWGFDGHAVPDRVNILTVRLLNDEAVPFKGSVRLIKSEGPVSQLGAAQEQECFISPGAVRWVQFYVYTSEPEEGWRLQWGAGRILGGASLRESPKFGPPARVILNEPDSLAGARTRLHGFPEDVFPPTVAATDGLWSVVLDHAPKWEPARREAFMDWLRRGGIVHVIYGLDGRYPKFAGEMEILNADKDRFRVGEGTVVRHALRRDELTEKAFFDAGFPGLALQNPERGYYGGGRVDQGFFASLRVFTRAKHPWGIIFTIVVAYFVVVGPVNFLLARRWRDWRRTTILHLVVVAAACVLLGWLGRRGIGESAAVNSFAYARTVQPGVYDVSQWVNAFAVRGGYYTFEYATPSAIFATCRDAEAVKGVIHNGPSGSFEADMPLYSERPFAFRGRMKGPDLALAVETWPGMEEPGNISILHGGAFPKEILYACAVVGAKVQPLEEKGGRLVKGESAMPVTALLKVVGEEYGNSRYGRSSGEEDRTVVPEEEYRKMMWPLMGRAMGGAEGDRFRIVRAADRSESGGVVSRENSPLDLHALPSDGPDDSIDVFVAAPCPASFRLLNNPFGRDMGYVVYHVRLFRP